LVIDKEGDIMSQDVNILALVKGEERYVFIYDDTDESQHELFRVLRRFASNPDLSFTWYDAAVLSQKVRQKGEKRALARRFHMPAPPSES